jgi:hypothetical protein
MPRNPFEVRNLLKLSGQYPLSRIPEGYTTSEPAMTASADLVRRAGAVADAMETAQTGGNSLTANEIQNLADEQNAIAQAHLALAEQLKGESPNDNINAISAHGDAYGAHLKAARVTEILLVPTGMEATKPVGQEKVVYAHLGWDSPMKAWKNAHRSFIASQKAYNNTVFDGN